MTVRELIAKLEKMPKNLPVYHPSPPWGCPFEIEDVHISNIGTTHSRKTHKAVMVDDDVEY